MAKDTARSQAFLPPLGVCRHLARDRHIEGGAATWRKQAAESEKLRVAGSTSYKSGGLSPLYGARASEFGAGSGLSI